MLLDSSNLKHFADDNFKFDENGRKFSKREENTVEIGEIARYGQILLFPKCFQKTFTAYIHVRTRTCLGHGLLEVCVYDKVNMVQNIKSVLHVIRKKMWKKRKCW